MKVLTINLFAVAIFALATNAQASGFRCEGEGYSAKLYNKTIEATRTPSRLVVSHEDANPHTLLVRTGEEIRKHNRLNSVQYVVDGNGKVGAETVILQINYKEGVEVLENGEEVQGQLILLSEGESREVIQLTCERYLKGESLQN